METVEQRHKSNEAGEPDMSWIDVAVQHGGRNAVIIDCSDGWKDYLTEFYIEDCVETSVALPTQAGLYRWSGFKVGYWGEDDLCQINGGTFARFEASLPPSAPDREGLIDFAMQYGPRCRDCGDEDGVCPTSGLPCGDQRKAIGYVVDALLYGSQHGHIASLALPPSGIAEAVRERCAKVVDAEYNLRIAHYRAAKDAGNKKETRDFETMAIAHSQSASAIRALDLSNMGDGE